MENVFVQKQGQLHYRQQEKKMKKMKKMSISLDIIVSSTKSLKVLKF